jgi:hypothetical protein
LLINLEIMVRFKGFQAKTKLNLINIFNRVIKIYN